MKTLFCFLLCIFRFFTFLSLSAKFSFIQDWRQIHLVFSHLSTWRCLIAEKWLISNFRDWLESEVCLCPLKASTTAARKISLLLIFLLSNPVLWCPREKQPSRPHADDLPFSPHPERLRCTHQFLELCRSHRLHFLKAVFNLPHLL